MPDFAPGVGKSHFDQLGTIEVLVLRCTSDDNSECDQSRTSSAVDAQPLDAIPAGEDEKFESTTDVENESPASEVPPAYGFDGECTSTGVAVESAGAIETEGGVFSFSGLFDGPSDTYNSYNRGAPAGKVGGKWSESVSQESSSKPPSHSGGMPSWQTAHSSAPHSSSDLPQSYGLPPGHFATPTRPGPGPMPRPEKHVHFDWGPQGAYPSLNTSNEAGRHSETPRGDRNWQEHGNAATGHPDSSSCADFQRQGSFYPASQPPYTNDFRDPYTHYGLHGSRYNDYYPYQMPASTPWTNGAYPQIDHAYAPPWAQFSGPPKWHRRPSLAPPGPDKGVYIPPYHQNHPFYAHVGDRTNATHNSSHDARWQGDSENQPENAGKGELDPTGQNGQEQGPQSGRWDEGTSAATGVGDSQGSIAINETNNDWSNSGTQNDEHALTDQSNEPSNHNGNSEWAQNNSGDNQDALAASQSNNDWGNTDTNVASNQINNDWNSPATHEQQSEDRPSNRPSDPQPSHANTWNETPERPSILEPEHDSPRSLYGPHGVYYSLNSSMHADPEAGFEEEPEYDVPQSIVDETGSTRQVQAGRGFVYVHKSCTPEYIDAFEEPYARFVFKYRTRGMI